jgi:ABC-type branched-subunit amino acid transport system substrate-binding protein
MTGIHDRDTIDRGYRGHRRGRGSRNGAVVLLAITALLVSACGSRLSGRALTTAEGAGGGGSTGSGGASGGGASGTGTAGSTGSAGSAAKGTSGLSGGTAGSAGTGSSGGTPGGGSTAGTAAPAGGNGGATDVGVTANSITVGNITSISGVAPGLTQSAQQATQAWAAYENSQGGIFGRQIKVQTADDGNDSGQNFAAASQDCTSDFAMVGNASGFDDGGATAVAKCGIPDMAAEVSTTSAGNVPQIFGASPGNAHYWPLGPANYLKSKYPNAVKKAAMIYLNIPAPADQATREMKANTSVGFDYIYTVSATATQSSYGPIVLAMQQKGVQYVTEYSPDFIKQTQPGSNGDLVLMATAAYEEAGSNPGMQLYLQWLNRVAPGAKHDIFGAFAWSAGLAFAQAARAVGPHLTRAGLLAQLAQIHNWTGGGVQPPEDLGNHVPSACFSYFTMQGSSFNRTYPAAANTFDCTGGLFKY